MKKLNLGCGAFPKEGWVNLDFREVPGVDVVHDLNVFPYPFPDNSFDEIESVHVLEHLDRPFEVMKELHRILKPNGVLDIKVPHFSRGFTHAEHAHGFDVTFPLYFNPKFTVSGYYGVHFESEDMRLKWFAFPHLLSYMGYGSLIFGLVNGISAVISFFASLSPAFASRIWCFWVGGFDEISFRFRCVKNN